MRSFKASFTVEASLIFPFILFSLVLVIYSGFYIHDRAALDAIAFESALRGSEIRYIGADIKGITEGLGKRLLENSTLACKSVQLSAEASEDEVVVTCKGEFDLPGSLIPGFQYSRLTIETRRSATRFCQTDFVRKCRMIENLKRDG